MPVVNLLFPFEMPVVTDSAGRPRHAKFVDQKCQVNHEWQVGLMDDERGDPKEICGVCGV